MNEQIRIEGDVDERPEPYPWTTVRQWVAASGVSRDAVAVYDVLAMLVWVNKVDDSFELYTDELAALVGLSRGDKVKRYVDELAAIGAVKVTQNGRGKPNDYKVYDRPPAGYTGPVSVLQRLKDYRKAAAALRGVSPAETPERGDGSQAGADDQAENTLRPAETPERGDGNEADKAAEPENGGLPAETPERGDGLETPDGGVLETPERGAISSYGFSVETETPTTPGGGEPAAAIAAGAVPQEEEQASPESENRDRLAAAVAEALRLQPGWQPAELQAAIAEALGRQKRSPVAVPDAVLALAAMQRAFSPRLLLQSGPWWASRPKPAATGDPAPSTAGRPGVPASQWCHRHPGHHDGGCRLCPTEDREADPLAADEARRIARDRAAAALAGARATQVRKDATAALRAAAAAMIRQRAPETEPVHEAAEV